MRKTRYIYRPNDYAVFVEYTENSFTLQSRVDSGFIITEYNSYSYDELINSYGFIECTEEELPGLTEKREEWTNYSSWSSRPDGHGGAKGGTFEEYLEQL